MGLVGGAHSWPGRWGGEGVATQHIEKVEDLLDLFRIVRLSVAGRSDET